MRTATYKSVRDKANVLFTGQSSVTTQDAATLNVFINARYKEYYERFFWPEWTVVEKRTFRQPFDGTTSYPASTIAAPTEVYFWPAQAYYQCLRPNLLTLTSLTRSGTTATATYAGGHLLTVSSTPRITIGGATPSGFNGTWNCIVTSPTQFTYTMPVDPGGNGSGIITAGINPTYGADVVASEYWAASESRYSSQDWTASAYLVGNQVYQPLDGHFYQCITAHTNISPPNPLYWGLLTDFERDIDFEPGGNQGPSATRLGEVKGVWNAHPWAVEDAAPQLFEITYDGLLVRGAEPVVWVEFRLRPNEFTGNPWASGTYAVGDQVYYPTTGDYYACIAPATTENPTDTTKWRKVEFPYVLKDAVAQSAFADLLKSAGKTSKYTEELREAGRLIQREFDKIERLQGQTRNLNVQVR